MNEIIIEYQQYIMQYITIDNNIYKNKNKYTINKQYKVINEEFNFLIIKI